MATQSLPTAPTLGNGHVPHRSATSLARAIDALAELRAQLKVSQARERELSGIVHAALDALGITEADGATATATLTRQTVRVIDADLFIRATGPAGWPAVRVTVAEAERLMAGDLLDAISEDHSRAVLVVRRVEAGR